MSAETRIDLLLSLATVSETTGAAREQAAILDHIEGDVDRLFTPDDPRWLRTRALRANLWTLGKIDGRQRDAESIALLEPLHAAMLRRADEPAIEVLLQYAAALQGANRSDDAQKVQLEARAIAAKLPLRAEETVLAVDTLRTSNLVYAQFYADALVIGDAALARWRARHAAPDRNVLSLLRALSLATEMTGDIARAEELYREAIDVAERLHVRPHPDTSWAIGVYGSFLVAQARYDEAEPHIVRALAMRRALLGEAHTDTLNAVAALGRLQAGRKQSTAALETFGGGIATCRRENVRENVCARLLGSHAQMLVGSGDLQAALAETEEAITLQRELTGPDSPQMAGVLNFHALVLLKLGRHEEVLHVTDEVARLTKIGGETGSKDVRYAQFRRAAALFGLGRNRESLDLITQTVDAQKRLTPNEKSTRFAMLTLMARAQSKGGDKQGASTTALEALSIAADARDAKPDDVALLREIASGADRRSR
jgi:serine/threonine-protein kinase